MGGVGLISPLEFLQLHLVIGFLDLLVQSALYSLQMCDPHKRGKAAPAPAFSHPVAVQMVVSSFYYQANFRTYALTKPLNTILKLKHASSLLLQVCD